MHPKKLYMKTFGCQMNVYDSERITHLLAARNYHLVEDPSEADLIFLNTCSVREKPEQKVYSALGRLRALKKKKSKLIIGIGGCLAQDAPLGLNRTDGGEKIVSLGHVRPLMITDTDRGKCTCPSVERGHPRRRPAKT